MIAMGDIGVSPEGQTGEFRLMDNSKNSETSHVKGRQAEVLSNAEVLANTHDNSLAEEQTVVGEVWKRQMGGRDVKCLRGRLT